MRSILFLDIDGVLNDHTWHQPADSYTFDKPCVERLNRIIKETNCQVVISSAWRYMVHRKAMTLTGFSLMMRTHGVTKDIELIGITHMDEPSQRLIQPATTRGMQIKNWMDEFGVGRSYCVVDDLDLDITKFHADRFIQINGDIGMTDEDADKIIEILSVRS